MPEFNKYDAPIGDIAVPSIGNSLACTGCKYDMTDNCPSDYCDSARRLDQTNVIFLTDVTPNIKIDIIQVNPISPSATIKSGE